MLTSAVMAQDLPEETKTDVLVAVNKIMWIQNDLFARHYIPSLSVASKIPKDGAMQLVVLALALALVWVLYAKA